MHAFSLATLNQSSYLEENFFVRNKAFYNFKSINITYGTGTRDFESNKYKSRTPMSATNLQGCRGALMTDLK